jgi:hypothetical protein
MAYKIDRPPLAKNFELPTREELLKLKPLDMVKLIFLFGEVSERMWVIITEQQNEWEWTGVLDNDPVDEEMKIQLKAGSVIKFHPLDIIQIQHDNHSDKNRQYLEKSYGIKIYT